MSGGLRVKVVLALTAVAAITFFNPTATTAHGATSNPASRVYTCRFEQPQNTMCANAWSQNSQSLYDWMEVNIGDVGGQHQQRIPDGQLCSAGRAKYAALDAPSAGWPIQALTANAKGNYRLEYTATAPHATAYFRFYLTRQGFDAANSPLGWGDLELVFDSGPAAAQASYSWDVSLPARTGHHILYTVWQRSDSPEAFYSCSDVRLSGGGGGTNNDGNGSGGGGGDGTSGQTTTSQATTSQATTATTARPTTASTDSSTTSTSSPTSASAEATTTSEASTTTTSAPATDDSTDADNNAVVTLLPGSSTASDNELAAASDALSGGDGLTPHLTTDPAVDRTNLITYLAIALTGLLAVSGMLIMNRDRVPTSRRRW